MRIHIRIVLVPFFAEALLAPATLHPPTASSAAHKSTALPEIAAGFSYMNSNAPVGGCGCFGVYGGSLAAAFPVARGPFAIVGDFTSGSSTSIAPNNYHLTLSTFTAGASLFAQFATGDATILSRRPPPALPTLHRTWWRVQAHRCRMHRRLLRRTWAASSISTSTADSGFVSRRQVIY